MTRIPYPDVSQMTGEKKAMMSGGRVLNVVRMSMHVNDTLWSAQSRLGHATVFGADMEERLREVLILRVAYLSDSEYELFHHLSIARRLGLGEDKIDALRTGDFALLSPEERAVAEFTSEVLLDISPSVRTLAAVRALFSDALVMEMVLLIGSYMTTARVIAVSGIECDTNAVEAWSEES